MEIDHRAKLDPKLLDQWIAAQANPRKFRKRELVWMLIAFLLTGHLLSRDPNEKIVDEAAVQACERHREAAQIHAATIAQLGENGGTISFAGKPAATCKRVKS